MIIKVKSVRILGMPLTEWEHRSCKALFAEGKDWATLYSIESKQEGKGHATHLLKTAKVFYEKQGKRFGGSVALNDRMKDIYKRLNIKEYDSLSDLL